MSIFKACDIRGAYPTELDEPLYADLGRAIGTALREATPTPHVVVAGDVRRSTPALRAALIGGLVATGCRVADIGIAPTPLAYFAARRLRPDGLAIVTASHNPAGDNGLKLMLGHMPITIEQMARVQRTLADRRFATGNGSVATASLETEYVEWLCSTAQPGRGMRLVLDCGNGTFSALAPRVLRRLGYDVVELFCTPDGTFPNRPPNPSIAENLEELRRTVPQAGALLGVALDGDGDRVAVADDTGRILTGDQAIMLLAQDTAGPGDRVVLDLKCSKAVLDVVAARGATPLLERSGHTFIKTRMIAERARFGGEISGHFFYRELDGGDDGLYSILRIAELAQRGDGPLSARVDALPRYAITPDIRVPHPAPDGPQRIEQLAAAATGQVLRLDGVRVAYPDGWALARCSVTEPLLTFRFESYTGRPRDVAQRFLAPAPDLLRAVLARLDALQTPDPEAQAP